MVRCSCVRRCVRVFVTLVYSVRFGQLLRCAHKHIVNIIKVYIDRNNILRNCGGTTLHTAFND